MMADEKQLQTTTARSTSERSSSSERGESVKNGGGSARKRNIAQLAAEKIEPYVRKRRCSGSSSERSRKRTEHLSEEDQNVLRLNINSKERKRMHDLNAALEGLRKAIPFVNGEGAKKMSKIDTIVIAKNWILQLSKELAELRENNERLLLELLAAKRNGQNAKTAKEGTNGAQKRADGKSFDVTGTASTSSLPNVPQSAAVMPKGVPPPSFVPFTAPIVSTNAAFLMQEKSNQFLGNAFAVQHLLAMKSDAVDLFGHLPAALFPANFQMPTNEQPRKEAQILSNRKKKTNEAKKEETKKSNGENGQGKSI